MKRIYQLQSQEHPERKTYYLFILAKNDWDAVCFANEKANIENIPYVFGESDIIFKEQIDEMPDGCFEFMEIDEK